MYLFESYDHRQNALPYLILIKKTMAKGLNILRRGLKEE